MSLKLIVLGAGGFVGQRLTLRLTTLKRFYVSPSQSLSLDKIILFDLNEPKDPIFQNKIKKDSRMQFVKGDICNSDLIMQLLDPENTYDRITVIHLAALLSGYSEQDFDLGMKINLFATLNIMECLRKTSAQKLNNVPQIMFYSSTDYVSAFTEHNRSKPTNEETFRLSPVSYGCQKACNEILISDYTRKGFIDGRVGRFAAVIGKAQFADVVSYAWHGIFSQTLQGKDYKCGLPMDTSIPCCSLTNVVENTIFLSGKVDSNKIGHNRTVCIPAKPMSLKQLWNETVKVAKKYGMTDKLGKVVPIDVSQRKTSVKGINVCPTMDYSKAELVGCDVNVDINEIITDFVETYVKQYCPHMLESRRSKL